MGVFDATFQGVAEAMIAICGQTGAVRRMTASGAAHDPTLTPADDYPATLAVFDYTDKEIDGTLIQQGDRKVYLSTAGVIDAGGFDDGFDEGFETGFTPTQADKIVIDQAEYEIVSVKPLTPAGTIFFWEIQARA